MMKVEWMRSMKRLCGTIAMLVLILMMAAAPVRAAETGNIRLGVLTDLTGKASAVLASAQKGFADYARYVNETDGGIEGHQIEVFTIDTQYEAAKSVAGYRKLVDVHKVHLINPQGSVIAAAIGQQANEDQVPMVINTALEVQFPMKDSFLFSATTPPEAFYPETMKWIVQNRFPQDKPVKIALFMIDIPWTNRVFKVLPPAIDELSGRAELVFKRMFAGTQLDFNAQVSELKDSGANLLFFVGHSGQTVAFLKEAHRTGLDQAMQIVEYPYTVEDGIRKAAGDDAVMGIITPSLVASWERTDVPGIQFLHDLNAKWHPDVHYRHWVYMVGWNWARVAVEGIRRAVDQVGYDKLTGDAVRQGLESLKNLDMQGIIPPITYSEDMHLNLGGVPLMQYKGGDQWELISPIIEMTPWSGDKLTAEYWK